MLSQSMLKRIDSAVDITPENVYITSEQKDSEIESKAGEEWDLEKEKNRYLYVQKTNAYSDRKEKQMEWWLGHVDHIYDAYFTAVLEDLRGITSIAEFELEELSPSEISLLVPNARFTYTVTQVDKHSGREYTSKLSFSGPSPWTEKDTERANELYNEIFPEELLDF